MSRHVTMSTSARVTVENAGEGIRMTSTIGGSGMIISIPTAEKARELVNALINECAKRGWAA